ncbi:MAG: hypothetical protein LUB61_07240 [Eggerthellaceae bacterium]|nr:hypothetical protein [Eggerthellaceae bacterium]
MEKNIHDEKAARPLSGYTHRVRAKGMSAKSACAPSRQTIIRRLGNTKASGKEPGRL